MNEPTQEISPEVNYLNFTNYHGGRGSEEMRIPVCKECHHYGVIRCAGGKYTYCGLTNDEINPKAWNDCQKFVMNGMIK